MTGRFLRVQRYPNQNIVNNPMQRRGAMRLLHQNIEIMLEANDSKALIAFDAVTKTVTPPSKPEKSWRFFNTSILLPGLEAAVGAVASMERAAELTVDYTKDRKAFGKPIIEFQNTAFKLAERKTEAMIARVFVDWCVEQLVAGQLDTVTASMAKYWCSQKQVETADECLQLHGGYGYMEEYPIARMFVDARIQKIYGGTNEIMKVSIARSL